MTDKFEEAFSKTDLQFNKYWLHNNYYIIQQEKKYEDNLYKECRILIDLFCLQQIKEVAYAISENIEVDIRQSINCYSYVVNLLEIDFNLFILLAGEEYVESEYNEGFYEDYCEDNRYNVLYFLLINSYQDILRYLMRYYKDEQKLLLPVIEPFYIYDEYRRGLQEIETLEDMFDHPEVVRLHDWARNGFDINGDQ